MLLVMQLGAITIDDEGVSSITELGLSMCRLPFEPMMAKSIIYADHPTLDCTGSVTMIGCLVQAYDRLQLYPGDREQQMVRREEFLRESGDHEMYLAVYEAWIDSGRDIK